MSATTKCAGADASSSQEQFSSHRDQEHPSSQDVWPAFASQPVRHTLSSHPSVQSQYPSQPTVGGRESVGAGDAVGAVEGAGVGAGVGSPVG